MIKSDEFLVKDKDYSHDYHTAAQQKWCTTSSAEQNKCSKMKTALAALTPTPLEINCVRKGSKFDCMQAVEGKD